MKYEEIYSHEIVMALISLRSQFSSVKGTGAPPLTLFFGPEKIYRVIGKTVL